MSVFYELKVSEIVESVYYCFDVLYYLSVSIFEKIYLPEFVVQISLHLTPWPIHTAINKPKLNCPRPQLTRTCIWGDQEGRKH